MTLPEQQVTPRVRLPFPWEPGEHMGLVGMTGSGKSTAAAVILAVRRYLVVLRTKPDRVRYGARLARRARAMNDRRLSRIVLDPPYEAQAQECRRALDLAWEQGAWTVYVDELYYADEQLGLEWELNRLLTQGRSKGVSLVTGMQRPVSVTRFALGEATHVLSFGLEGRDVRTIAEVTSENFARTVAELERYEFAWWYKPQPRDVWRGRVQELITEEAAA